MKEKLIAAGFQEVSADRLSLTTGRFGLRAWLGDKGWMYDWVSHSENCGGGPYHLQNITQLNFYL